MLVSASRMTKQRTAPSVGGAKKTKEVEFFSTVKSEQIISDHLSDRGVSSQSIRTSWVWVEMLASKVRAKLDHLHARKCCVHFREGLICVRPARQSPKMICGTEFYIYTM